MAVILSQHTRRKMSQGNIALADIEGVPASPAYMIPDPVDPTLTRSFGPVAAFGNRMLRVVHRPEEDDTFVITAHWGRGAKR